MEQSMGRGGGRVIGEYSVGRQLGSGSFSVVWHGRHRVHGTEVAIKEIAMDRLNKKLQESLRSEIFILNQINHPNIIRLHDIIEASGRIHLVLEYCRGGDLYMYIQRHKRVPEATAKHFMQQLAAGLKVLRENNLIHRDLKPQNLLLSSNSENSVLKIADFGFARSLQPRGLAETMCGSPLYMAPEIMQLQKYDAKADLWSVGAILFQLVTGVTPFTGNNQIQLLQNIVRSTELRFPADIVHLSPQCIDLCKKLLRRNPVERLTFDEFFNHPFLSNIQPDEIYRSRDLSMPNAHFPLLDCTPTKSIEGSSPDDCLPFLLDDDSSGPDGSPSYFRRSSIKSSGCSPELRNEALFNASQNIGVSSRSSTITANVKNSGFRIDNRSVDINTRRSPARKMEPRVMGSLARAGEAVDLIDQEDYVLVPESIADLPSPSVGISQSPSKTQSTSIRYSNANSKASAPMAIVGALTRDSCPLGSLESQCSDPPGTSQGSTDFVDTQEQQSANPLTRIKSFQKCAATIKELIDEKMEVGRHLEAFSIQLVILAIWKQSLHICHAQAVSSREGSPSVGTTKLKVTAENKHGTPDSHAFPDINNSKDLEDVSSEIKREFFKEVGHAEELSKFIDPDAMETIYQSALALGRNGAVDELMGDMENAALSYSKATQLLVFLLVEAPSLLVNPPFSLTNSDRLRLRTYINILSDRQGLSRSRRMAFLKTEDQQGSS